MKLALEGDQVVGMVQYLPIEHTWVEGSGLYFIPCIWVHGYKDKGVGNWQHKGIGSALLGAAEEEARAKGAQGTAAWGLALPFWMKASWFKRHGYRPADRMGLQTLLWKPFAPEATPPRWLRKRKEPVAGSDRVEVVAFLSGWCPAYNLTYERARRAAAACGEAVNFVTIDTSERPALLEWGISDALYIDGKRVRTGPPPSYQAICKRMARRVQHLQR
ncbi:MAG: GNAT family N-acetyltransferase [bacterium]|nr:GNAT family N-acetyltransferase [candidate division KSB1 bacterium]MDH7561666.1 GNAT family N-acetyltransferase [bacterium]